MKKNYITKELYIISDLNTGITDIRDHYTRGNIDLLSYIENLIEESINNKAEIKVYIDGLSYIMKQLVNYFHKLGYSFECARNKKNMHVHDVRYSVGKGNMYFYQVKTGSYSFITFQNIEKVIGRRDYITEDAEADEDFKVFYQIKEKYTGSLKYPESRILYTISSISRGMYNRAFPSYGGPWWKTRNIKFDGREYKANMFLESYCRPGYHGGYDILTQNGREYQGPVTVVDCNSIYPYVANMPMPQPVIANCGSGEVPKRYRNTKYYFSVCKVIVSLTLKDDGIAMLQKDGSSNLSENYLSKCQNLKMTVNSYDLAIMKENYHIWRLTYISHITFFASRNLFRGYTGPLYEEKRTHTGTKRTVPKLLMNGLLGTFSKKVYKSKDVMHIDDNGEISLKKEALTEEEYERAYSQISGYIYLGAAITSAARWYLSHFIKKVDSEKYLYSDTDSIHIAGNEIPEDIPISDKMGDFKIEHHYNRVVYRNIKEYIAEENGVIIFTLAGISHISTGLLKAIPDWCKGYQRKSIFEQNRGRVQECVKKHNLTKLFEICLPCITLTENMQQGLYFEIVWRPVLSFDKIKRRNGQQVHIKVKHTNISDLIKRDQKKDKYWNDTHKADPIPVNEWLLKIHHLEKEQKELEALRKTGWEPATWTPWDGDIQII